MTDTCRRCEVRGNIVDCRNTPCHTHESWYAQQQEGEIERLENQVFLANVYIKDLEEHEGAEGFSDSTSELASAYYSELASAYYAEAALNTEVQKT